MQHIHHIVPRHSEPGIANNCPENLISLSIEEHAEAHKQLWLMNRHWQDELAYLTLSGQISTADARIAAIKAANTGRKLSQATREKLSAIRRGRKHSIQHRANISAAQKGKTISVEQRKKISASMRGRKLSDEHKANIRANLPSQKGRIFTAEHRTRLSLAAKQRKSRMDRTA
jgi:NUMOD3 motif